MTQPETPFIVDIKPAKRRFGRTPRKQWRFSITAANGKRIDPRDTLANVGDILDILQAFRERPVQVRVHYEEPVGVRSFDWPAP
jgi:hypothetical protein